MSLSSHDDQGLETNSRDGGWKRGDYFPGESKSLSLSGVLVKVSSVESIDGKLEYTEEWFKGTRMGRPDEE